MKENSILRDLFTRPFKEDVTEYLVEFQEYTGIIFPPIYKVFQETFLTGSGPGNMGYDYYLKVEYNDLRLISRDCDFRPKSNYLEPIEYFYSLEEMKIVLKKYNYDDTFDPATTPSLTDKKLLPIIKHTNEVLVCVGYSDKNSDKIYIYNTEAEGEDRFVKIANNIFHYLRGTIVFDASYETELYAKLYRKWNEDFWRLKK